jgi:zinc metalloprotease ZmpB
VHADGEMWSAALWRARGLIGNTNLTDKVIIAAQFGFRPDTTFRAAALETIDTAKDYGVASEFRKAFTERGFLG